MRAKLSKLMKASALAELLEQQEFLSLNTAQQKKYSDSIEPILRQKVQTLFQRSIYTILQSPAGVPQYIGDEYCKAIALYYDPHTEYFPATEKEDFESELGADKLVFGFGLKENNKEGVRISELRPGSPAYKSGQLNTGDKIESIQWTNRQPIDVSSASVDEVSQVLGESNYDEAIVTVKKEDGTTRKVKLVKEKMEADEDDSMVKSFVLKGAKTIGYISLPAFYTDYEASSYVKGCANDVAKEIIKLKKENIDAIILDIRYNGGGSMQEAVELAGIFIDAGPVEMIKDKGVKIATLKDINRGTIYDGPLLVMINGYSASASEMVAGTLQDYNRAIIMGSPSYGKATAQIVLPLDTTVSLEKDFENIHTDSYIKLTVSQLYRISGKTAQFTGVVPDVVLPEVLDADPKREADNPFALQPNTIDANKYYQPLPALPISSLQAEASKDMQASAYFDKLNKYIARSKQAKQQTDISLKLADVIEKYKAEQTDDVLEEDTTVSTFSIDNNAFEKQRLQADSQLASTDTTWKTYLQKDPYLKIAYKLLVMMSK
jgi:carboxyl-terminal processing protease